MRNDHPNQRCDEQFLQRAILDSLQKPLRILQEVTAGVRLSSDLPKPYEQGADLVQ
jgi:hypothetical protein